MRLLLIHPDAQSFSGAEMMLLYFLKGLGAGWCEPVVAVAKGSKLAALISDQIETTCIEDNRAFNVRGLKRQLTDLVRLDRVKRFDMIHGWAARDWELAALLGKWIRRPSVGTLHDHPKARFISLKRRLLMRWSARWGLARVVCVSEAVRLACLAAGYPKAKLRVVHNGLPDCSAVRPPRTTSDFRLGFLGAFSERKGLQLLFAIASELSHWTTRPWELHLAGEAQEDAGRRLLEQIHQRFCREPWWSNVHWHGWVKDPQQFLRTLDLLVVPSSEFDPFPTVLLEAGQVGVPVLAANVGGVSEIVVDGETGLLFDPGFPRAAAGKVAWLMEESGILDKMSERVIRKANQEFSVGKMVANYSQIYPTLATRTNV